MTCLHQNRIIFFIHILYELIIYVYTILKREEGLHMADNKNKSMLKKPTQVAIRESKANTSQGRQFLLWFGALILGGILGWLGIQPLNEFFNFVATVFTRLFQFIAVPTIRSSSYHYFSCTR